MIEGVNQVLLEVEDQDRALEFWTESIGFELAQDARYGEGTPWLEVRTRDKAVTLVLSRRRGKRPTKAAERPASYIFLYCDDLPGTYEELRGRGVDFSHPPDEQGRGWWSMFEDQEGNRFALVPREAA